MSMTNGPESAESRPCVGHPPVVLAAGGLDPTGSAGLLADVRILSAVGCHPCGIVTCETVQSSRGVTGIRPTDPELLGEQLNSLLSDLKPDAVKIGALASVATIEVLGEALRRIPDVPVILDPIFEPTSGPPFLNMDGMRAMSRELLEQTLVATPNVLELGAPAGLKVDQDDDDVIEGCASGWFAAGVEALLVTGLRREGKMVDRLIRLGPDADVRITDISHPAYKVGKVHGTGCVLASAVAGYIARGEKLEGAVRKAVNLTSRLIEQACRIGSGAAFWIDIRSHETD